MLSLNSVCNVSIVQIYLTCLKRVSTRPNLYWIGPKLLKVVNCYLYIEHSFKVLCIQSMSHNNKYRCTIVQHTDIIDLNL